MTNDALESAPIDADSGLGWRPPRWVMRSSVFVQWCLWLAGCAVAAACFFPAALAWWSVNAGGVLLALLMWPLAVLVHELGHLAGAKVTCMTVYSMQVSWVHFQAQRRGWRMRLQRPPPYASGFVMAFPDATRPLRRQSLLMIAGGPAASLSVGLTAGAAGILFVPGEWGLVLVGFAAMNVTAGLVSLLPSERWGPSDGLMILCWLRGVDETSPEFHLQHLNGLAAAGTPVDELPVDRIAGLAKQPQPGPLLAIWFRMKAHQFRDEWIHAAALETEMDAAVSQLSPEVADALKDFVSILHCESRFSSAMLTWSAAQSPAEALTPLATWSSPSLAARCESLMAALSGDKAGAVKHLDEAEFWASRSVDKALAITERRIRRTLLSRLDTSHACSP